MQMYGGGGGELVEYLIIISYYLCIGMEGFAEFENQETVSALARYPLLFVSLCPPP